MRLRQRRQAGALSPLWRAAQELDPAVRDVSAALGAREGQVAAFAQAAGLVNVQSSRLTVDVGFPTFDEWWRPLALGVGSGGAYVRELDEPRRERCASGSSKS